MLCIKLHPLKPWLHPLNRELHPPLNRSCTPLTGFLSKLESFAKSTVISVTVAFLFSAYIKQRTPNQ